MVSHPLYAMYASLNLIDTLQGVILFFVASALPFCIWLMKNFFDSVPFELEEAAWIDGASILQSLLYVLFPLAAPGIAVVGVWSFLVAWTNFFVPLIILQSENLLPAPVHIYTFFGSYGQVNYGQLAAYAMLYALPAVVLYTLVSRLLLMFSETDLQTHQLWLLPPGLPHLSALGRGNGLATRTHPIDEPAVSW